jgi:hypothetical protein
MPMAVAGGIGPGGGFGMGAGASLLTLSRFPVTVGGAATGGYIGAWLYDG